MENEEQADIGRKRIDDGLYMQRHLAHKRQVQGGPVGAGYVVSFDPACEPAFKLKNAHATYVSDSTPLYGGPAVSGGSILGELEYLRQTAAHWREEAQRYRNSHLAMATRVLDLQEDAERHKRENAALVAQVANAQASIDAMTLTINGLVAELDALKNPVPREENKARYIGNFGRSMESMGNRRIQYIAD